MNPPVGSQKVNYVFRVKIGPASFNGTGARGPGVACGKLSFLIPELF